MPPRPAPRLNAVPVLNVRRRRRVQTRSMAPSSRARSAHHFVSWSSATVGAATPRAGGTGASAGAGGAVPTGGLSAGPSPRSCTERRGRRTGAPAAAPSGSAGRTGRRCRRCRRRCCTSAGSISSISTCAWADSARSRSRSTASVSPSPDSSSNCTSPGSRSAASRSASARSDSAWRRYVARSSISVSRWPVMNLSRTTALRRAVGRAPRPSCAGPARGAGRRLARPRCLGGRLGRARLGRAPSWRGGRLLGAAVLAAPSCGWRRPSWRRPSWRGAAFFGVLPCGPVAVPSWPAAFLAGAALRPACLGDGVLSGPRPWRRGLRSQGRCQALSGTRPGPTDPTQVGGRRRSRT